MTDRTGTDPVPLVAGLAELSQPPPATLLRQLGESLGVGDTYVLVEGRAGAVWVAYNDRGVNLLTLASDETDERHFLSAYTVRYGHRPLRRAAVPPPQLASALRRSGEDQEDHEGVLRYDLAGLSPFQQAVFRKTAEIPAGEVRPYAWVAREVGQPGAVRAVGTALGRNPVPILIPCHRVVRSDGRIGDYALGPAMKQRLLTQEGVDLRELVALAGRGIRYVGSQRTASYCLPTCRVVRATAPGERALLRSAAQALSAGYTPCSRCRPSAEAA